jgi:Carboxypeptidase regulatory-like domain
MTSTFKTSLTLLIIFWMSSQALGQSLTQTVKGTVLDRAVKLPLEGASVAIFSQQNTLITGTSTDSDGRFRLEKVPAGTHKIRVTYVGYKEKYALNVTVNTGKEPDLTIEMEENLSLKEVVITAEIDKTKPLNELSAVSTRTFSVEESQRFAAAVNDPARMASAFAGVAVGNDGSNEIVIRGNAPNSMLWRMEGVDIPNPNHFSAVGTSGGGISILSAQVLSNSDFSTGAFAAEYGNALSGVFDIKLRKGNSDKREYTAQVGVLGIDLATEGPLALGAKKGSYLVNYRYSTLGVLGELGVNLGPAKTTFQDLSFHINLPTSRLGNFTVFGMGGFSKQTSVGTLDTSKWNEDLSNRYTSRYGSQTGVTGVTHQMVRGTRFHLKTVVAASGTVNEDYFREYQQDSSIRILSKEKHTNTKFTLSSVASYKINPRNYLRAGAYVNQLDYDLNQAAWLSVEQGLIDQVTEKGATQSLNTFAQWQHRPTDRVTTSLGVHAISLFLNNTVALDPRASIKYQTSPKSNISLGYGLHSQMQPLGVYFAKKQGDTGFTRPNQDLGFSKAHHLVLAYDYSLSKTLRFKTEAYYQALVKIPVQRDSATSFSILNLVADYPAISLENKGLGRNYGLEFTLEKFMNKGLYFLASSSLYDSEYRGSDGKWRNTLYNVDYVHNIVGGKEWSWNRNDKSRTFGVNMKITSRGGLRQTPLDLQASILEGTSKYDETRAFEQRNKAYLRLDAGIRIKRNYRSAATTLSLDIQNVTNRANTSFSYFDPIAQQEKFFSQVPLLPILAYKVEW